MLADELFEHVEVEAAGAEGLDTDRHRLGHADRVGQLDFAARRDPGLDQVLGHPTGGIGCTAIDLRRVLAREGAAAVTPHAAVGVDDDLASGEPSVAHGAADHEAAGGVHMEDGVVVNQLARQGRPDHVVNDVLAELVPGYVGRVLGRQHHRRNVLGGIAVVFDRHLRLGIGPQVLELAALEERPMLLDQLVGQTDWRRHQLGGLVAGVPEHHSLIARALFLVEAVALGHALGDVGGLPAQRDLHGAGARIETHVGARVADVGHHLADQRGDLDLGLGGHLAGNHHQARGGQRFAGDPGVGILRQHGVQDRVGDLVAHLVGMAHRNRFGSEQRGRHSGNSCVIQGKRAL